MSWLVATIKDRWQRCYGRVRNCPARATKVEDGQANGRAIKTRYRPEADTKVVFIGPCIANKAEMVRPEVAGAIDAVLTFREFRMMLGEECVDPDALPESRFDGPRIQNRQGLYACRDILASYVRAEPTPEELTPARAALEEYADVDLSCTHSARPVVLPQPGDRGGTAPGSTRPGPRTSSTAARAATAPAGRSPSPFARGWPRARCACPTSSTRWSATTVGWRGCTASCRMPRSSSSSPRSSRRWASLPPASPARSTIPSDDPAPLPPDARAGPGRRRAGAQAQAGARRGPSSRPSR